MSAVSRGELFQVGAGQLLDVDRFEVGGAQFQHLGAQQETAAIAGDVAQLLEREQAASGGGRRHARAARDVAEAERGVIAPEGADHRKSLWRDRPIASRRRAGMRVAVTDLDTHREGGSVSFRITTIISLSENQHTGIQSENRPPGPSQLRNLPLRTRRDSSWSGVPQPRRRSGRQHRFHRALLAAADRFAAVACPVGCGSWMRPW